MERSLATLVGMLEQMTPDVEREKQDVEDAGEFLRSLEEAYEQAGRKLKSARDELARAQRDMARAGQQRKWRSSAPMPRARPRDLVSATSGLNVALKAMQDNAQRDLVRPRLPVPRRGC